MNMHVFLFDITKNMVLYPWIDPRWSTDVPIIFPQEPRPAPGAGFAFGLELLPGGGLEEFPMEAWRAEVGGHKNMVGDFRGFWVV